MERSVRTCPWASEWSALGSKEPEYWTETLIIEEEDSVGRRGGPGRRGYPAELRRRVIDLLDSGRKVADVARELGVSEQAIYGWRRQERIDRGIDPGLSTLEQAELAAATRRIRECEAGQPGRQTPILALTANTLVEDRYACFEAGMDGFLIKPLDREKLADALAGLAASRHLAA